MEKKQEALDYITQLQMANRDINKDSLYLYQACQYLQTEDKSKWMPKLKGYRKPFQRQLDQGEKISDFEFVPPDYANTKIVPSPRMGGLVSDKYDMMMAKILNKKY